MGSLAIILARGGSKGVPRKNVRQVGGRPCVAWTIDAARASDVVDRIVVTTDDAEVREIARSMDIEVIERPDDLASDTATVDDAARHALRVLEEGDDPVHDPFVLLYANVPVRPADLIDRAVRLQIESGCDSVQSYAAVGKHHPWWTAVVDPQSGEVHAFDGGTLNHGVYRRQELPAAHVPDGGVLVVSRGALMLELDGAEHGPHRFFGIDRRGVVTREGEVIDIDAEIDLLVADAVLRSQSSSAVRT